jgi:antitoxin ParD1/3/4
MIQITLTQHQEQFVTEQLASGNFTNPEEVVTTAFTLLEKLQSEYQDWLTETRSQLEAAAAELDRDDSLDGEIFVSELLEKFQQAKGV